MLSRFIGSKNAKIVRSKYSDMRQAANKKYSEYDKGRQRVENLRDRFPDWDMRGSYKTTGMDGWHLQNAVNSAKRDGYSVKLVPSTNGRGEKVKVLFIQRRGQAAPKKRAPRNSKDLVPKTLALKGKKFHLVGIGSLDYAIDRKKGFQYDGYLATTRKIHNPLGETAWAVYAYRR